MLSTKVPQLTKVKQSKSKTNDITLFFVVSLLKVKFAHIPNPSLPVLNNSFESVVM